jgi:hypothetical protein
MMRGKCSIIKKINEKSITTEKKRISISPILTYIDNDDKYLRKTRKYLNKYDIIANINNNENNDSDFEYY